LSTTPARPRLPLGPLSRGWRAAVGTAALILTFPVSAGAQAGDTWQPIDPLPTPRRLLAAAEEGGRVYTFGGCGSPCFGPPAHSSTFEETRVEVLDPAPGRWSGGRAPIPAIFFGGAAAAPGNGRVYLLGGFLTGDRTLEYTPASDSWRSRAPMPSARHGLAAVAIGGEVYAVGGSDGTAASGALEIYDLA
jgi:N-acetylneuraminic acid mutarotase